MCSMIWVVYLYYMQLDLGLVFDEPGKCFIHKWLLLTDPDDPSNDTKVRTCGHVYNEGTEVSLHSAILSPLHVCSFLHLLSPFPSPPHLFCTSLPLFRVE